MALLVDPLQISMQNPRSTALVSNQLSLTYGDLVNQVEKFKQQIDLAPPGLMAIAITPTISSVISYLAAISSNRPLVLLDPESDMTQNAWLFKNYDPAIIYGFEEAPPGFTRLGELFIHPTSKVVSTACLCLTTSGSTGSPKLVRLSHKALTANAQSISIALGIDDSHRAITSLPLNYSYGLSVLNSHLLSGAQIVLTNETIITRGFWSTFDERGCTSFAGVPYSYTLLRRLRFSPSDHPSLKSMTQAGGRLDLDSRKYFYNLLDSHEKQFVIMYGQTEATARMSILQHQDFIGHEESVGKAIPLGKFEILSDNNAKVEFLTEGQIFYSGPNVMDCYVSNSEDFDQASESLSQLNTGDRGYLDEDGFLYITGREKRIGKVYGTRINLDEVEEQIRVDGFSCAVTNMDDELHFFFEKNPSHSYDPVLLAGRFQLHSSVIKIHVIDSLPLLGNGKINYAQLHYL